ncbi:GNAT family N-acetyltransferase [Diaphorobacter sp.]|uniref:GNAT family N-acetyltransferase n=1 Tax=Diaphorobacter sp. TaxID=1934310 RepID=UPI003D11D31F
MPDEVFQTEVWFANLLAHGLVRRPIWQGDLAVSSRSGDLVHLPLMQESANGPLCAVSNYYSGIYGPVGSERAIENIGPADWLAAAQGLRRLPHASVLRLQPLDADSTWLAGWQTGLRDAGYWTSRFFCFGNWHQPVSDKGFEDYWQQRPSALQHTVERARKRLSRAGDWRIDIQADESPGLQACLAAYLAVYAQSWKQAEPCPHFMPALMHMAAQRGWLRLGVLWLGQQPLAAQVWLVCDGKASIYKLAYVKGHEKLSAGSVLTAALMQHVMDVDRVREVDYLSGDDAYKRDWMALRRERVGLLAFDPRRVSGLLAASRHFAGRLLRAPAGPQTGT